MKMKKNVLRLLPVGIMSLAIETHAAGYEPLVHIPGLPTAEGSVVDISAYLIGIYNFALSIVGIVAVIMLIIGGMKYITAATNVTSVGEAKSTIWGALSGLLLALLSWVIISTINPDILYLREPGAAFNESLQSNLTMQCGTYSNGRCTCQDGYPTASAAANNQDNCNLQCFKEGRCNSSYKCIAPGSPNTADAPGYRAVDGCTCGDGTKLLLPDGMTCDNVCRTANKCGNKFLAIRLGIGHNYDQDHQYYTLSTDSSLIPQILGGGQPDELWGFKLTNKGNYDDFDIKPDVINYSDDYPEFDCALLITRRKPLVGETSIRDDHWVYWVKENTRIIPNGSTLYDQLKLGEGIGGSLVQDCCNTLPSCQTRHALGMEANCSKEQTDYIMRAKFGDDILNKCVDCSAAYWNGDKPTYRPAQAFECINGYWR